MSELTEMLIKDLEDKVIELQLENARLNDWITDLQSGMYINCVYCGHRYGPDPGTPVAMAEVLKKHIEACPKHPMSALKAENTQLRQDLKLEAKARAQAIEIQAKLMTENDELRRTVAELSKSLKASNDEVTAQRDKCDRIINERERKVIELLAEIERLNEVVNQLVIQAEIYVAEIAQLKANKG